MIYFAKTEPSLFIFAVIQILNNKTSFIPKRFLGFFKRYAVFGDVLPILAFVPFKIRCFHDTNVIQKNLFVNKDMLAQIRYTNDSSSGNDQQKVDLKTTDL